MNSNPRARKGDDVEKKERYDPKIYGKLKAKFLENVAEEMKWG